LEAEEPPLSGRALLVWEREWGRVGEQADGPRKVVSSDLEGDGNGRHDEPSLALKKCFEYAGERPHESSRLSSPSCNSVYNTNVTRAG